MDLTRCACRQESRAVKSHWLANNMTRLSDAPQMPMAPTAPEGQAPPTAVVANPMAMAQPEPEPAADAEAKD